METAPCVDPHNSAQELTRGVNKKIREEAIISALFANGNWMGYSMESQRHTPRFFSQARQGSLASNVQLVKTTKIS